MNYAEFKNYLTSNIPLVGDRTAKRLIDASIDSIERLNKATREELRGAGLRRPAINGILLYLAKRERLYRFNKGFDSHYDPSDLFYLIPSCMIALSYATLLYMDKLNLLGTFVVIAWVATDFLCGLYWLFVLVQREEAGKFLYFSVILVFPFFFLQFLKIVKFTDIEYSLPAFLQGSLLFWLIALGYDKLFKYRSPLNIKISSIELLAVAVSVLALFALLVHSVLLLSHLYIFSQLTIIDAIGLILFFALLAISILLGYQISERKRLTERTTLFRIYFLVFSLFTIYILKWVGGIEVTPLFSLVAIDVIKVAIPLIFLYIYLLFPTKHFPRLGRLFLVLLIAISLIPFLRHFNVFQISKEAVWLTLGRIADVLQIVSFLFFSGALVHLLMRKTDPRDEGDLAEQLRDACTEILSWSDNREPYSKYLSYWEVSNLCFQQGFFAEGVGYLRDGLQKRKWLYYDEAILRYQLSCGYSLIGDCDTAMDYLREALKLYPYLKKFVASDEMLDNIRADIIAENLQKKA